MEYLLLQINPFPSANNYLRKSRRIITSCLIACRSLLQLLVEAVTNRAKELRRTYIDRLL